MFMKYTNYKGVDFDIGDEVYFNVVEKGAMNVITRRTKIKSFLIKKDAVYVVAKYGKSLTYVNIDELYKSEDEAKEVVIRWQRDVLRNQLQQEITSYLKNQ